MERTEEVLLAAHRYVCYEKQDLLFTMNWKLTKFLLSTSLIIAAFGQHNKVNAELERVDTEKYGTFRFAKPLSLHNYAQSRNGYTKFAVAIMTPNQFKDNETGIAWPSVIWVDCKNGLMMVNTTKKTSAQDSLRTLAEDMKLEATRFCQTHKRIWKHSRW